MPTQIKGSRTLRSEEFCEIGLKKNHPEHIYSSLSSKESRKNKTARTKATPWKTLMPVNAYAALD